MGDGGEAREAGARPRGPDGIPGETEDWAPEQARDTVGLVGPRALRAGRGASRTLRTEGHCSVVTAWKFSATGPWGLGFPSEVRGDGRASRGARPASPRSRPGGPGGRVPGPGGSCGDEGAPASLGRTRVAVFPVHSPHPLSCATLGDPIPVPSWCILSAGRPRVPEAPHTSTGHAPTFRIQPSGLGPPLRPFTLAVRGPQALWLRPDRSLALRLSLPS